MGSPLHVNIAFLQTKHKRGESTFRHVPDIEEVLHSLLPQELLDLGVAVSDNGVEFNPLLLEK